MGLVSPEGGNGDKASRGQGLVAKELLNEPQKLLEPLRFSRYETGELHPTSTPLPAELTGGTFFEH
jgi:methylglutamate dehydrogenase subunit A